MAQAARCLLATQGPCSRNEGAWETICLSCYTHWQHKCSLSHFHAICWKMIHGVSASCGLSTTAPVLGSRPWRGRLPALSEVVKLPTRSLVPLARRGDGMAASPAAPAAPGGLLLLGTSSQTMCLFSQKQGMEQGGCTCWVPGECSA